MQDKSRKLLLEGDDYTKPMGGSRWNFRKPSDIDYIELNKKLLSTLMEDKNKKL